LRWTSSWTGSCNKPPGCAMTS